MIKKNSEKTKADNFFTPGVNYKNIDIYYKYRTVKEIIPAGNGNCLDIGSRDSNLKKYVLDKGYKYIGLDISFNNALDVIGDGCCLPFADNSFDLVVMSQVLEHVLDPKTAVIESSRILKPGGVLVGGVSFLEPFHESYYNLSHRALENILFNANLNKITIETGVTGVVLIVARVLGLTGSSNLTLFSWCGRIIFPVKYFLKSGYWLIRIKNTILGKDKKNFKEKARMHYEKLAITIAGHLLFSANK